MTMRIKPTAVVFLIVLVFSAGLLADNGKELYQFRYSDQRKQVDATANKADDVALAAEHLKDTVKYVDNPVLLRVLCEEAYELGMRDRSGYATAAEAVETLLAKFPAERDAYRAKALHVYEVQYRRGIDRVNSGEKMIDLYLEQAAAKAKTGDFLGATLLTTKAYGAASGVKSLRKSGVTARRAYYQIRRRMQQTPGDPKLRSEAIRLCVAEMDNPAEAVTLLDDSVGEPFRTYVPLAANRPEEVLAPACLELGYWYEQLAKRAGTAGKAVCLRRAGMYLERYLELHEGKDEARTKAELLLDRVDKEIGKLKHAARPLGPGRPKPKEALTTGRARRIDLLKLIDPAKHGVSGRWEKKDNMVGVLPSPYARLTLPVAPDGDYMLGVVFVRKSGRYVAVILPVGSGAVAFYLGFSDYPTLRTIDGSTYYNRESRLGRLTDGKEYSVVAKVAVRKDQARLVIYVNGELAIQWQGSTSALVPFSGWRLPDPGTFGLGANDAQVLFKEAKVVLDKAPKAPPTLSVRPLPPTTARPTVTPPAAPPKPVATARTLALKLAGDVTMKLVRIPDGEFMMGSPPEEAGRGSNESPRRKVTIGKSFYMAAYEVTQAQWKSAMGTTPWSGKKNVADGATYPATYISHADAVKFCEALSRTAGRTVRLPTEAEWEYACRAGSQKRHCFGDDVKVLGEYAWYIDNSRSGMENTPRLVGTKRPNAWGLHDMHGNVLEWCADWYGNYRTDDVVDSTGPSSGHTRVFRGGRGASSANDCRAAARWSQTPGYSTYKVGFRVVVPIHVTR